MADDVGTTLAQVEAAVPGGGESRQGQQEMAVAGRRSIAEQRHLVVQAGTGTGKSLAYLIPAALSDQRIVVATATKALQDQLAHSDLPRVAHALRRAQGAEQLPLPPARLGNRWSGRAALAPTRRRGPARCR